MEAVPRLPMLSFELKHSPEYVEFGPALKQYIRDHYGEDPALYNKACTDLEQLRQASVHVTRDFMGCSTLKKYYSQLQFLQGRFPMGEGAEASIAFTWEDIQTGREYILGDIKFEQACILYNIGALHSILGAVDTRNNADGMKVSCTHFQCAAWSFEHLRDHFGSSGMSTDMSHELLTFHISLMLAQGQECILEKSMIDSRKNTITAKVSAQVVDFYRTAIKNLETCNQEGVVSSRCYKDWKKRMELKTCFYECITFYYMGRQAEEQQKMGERLAYFQAAQDKLSESVKVAKNDVSEVQDALKFAQDVVGGKLNSAKKDNDFVYHEKVPALESLPEIKGASLVKGIPFNPNDPEISGPDIFQKLVPMEAHEASSVYSEEKAKLLRKVSGDVEEKTVELQQYMSSLQLDPNKLMPQLEPLPQELLEKCAAMSVKTGAIQNLIESMAAVASRVTEVELNLKDIISLLDNEKHQEEEFQKKFGGSRAANIVLTELRKEYEVQRDKHKQGSQTNEHLHKAMNVHIANLRLLAGAPDELQATLPKQEITTSAEDQSLLQELRRLLAKVEEMRAQRLSLIDDFRNKIQTDDITNVLVTQDPGNKDMIFGEQLKKHEKLVNLIHQNLSAQDNVLRALTDANARYATIRKATSESIARRDARISELIKSYEVYEDLMGKSQKGLEYYTKLEETVTRILQRCRSVCKVQQEERDQITKRFAPKEAPPSRPAAPKPLASQVASNSIDAATGGSFPAEPSLPTFEGPKLKDYLPFMKPATFGAKAGIKSTCDGTDQIQGSSLPTSLPGSPVHQARSGSPRGSPSRYDHTIEPFPGIEYQGLPTELTAQLAKLPPGFFNKMKPAGPDVTDVSQGFAQQSVQPPVNYDIDPNLPPEIQAHLSKLPKGFFTQLKSNLSQDGLQDNQPSSLPHFSQGHGVTPNLGRTDYSSLPDISRFPIQPVRFESTNTVSSVETPVISSTKGLEADKSFHNHNYHGGQAGDATRQIQVSMGGYQHPGQYSNSTLQNQQLSKQRTPPASYRHSAIVQHNPTGNQNFIDSIPTSQQPNMAQFPQPHLAHNQQTMFQQQQQQQQQQQFPKEPLQSYGAPTSSQYSVGHQNISIVHQEGPNKHSSPHSGLHTLPQYSYQQQQQFQSNEQRSNQAPNQIPGSFVDQSSGLHTTSHLQYSPLNVAVSSPRQNFVSGYQSKEVSTSSSSQVPGQQQVYSGQGLQQTNINFPGPSQNTIQWSHRDTTQTPTPTPQQIHQQLHPTAQSMKAIPQHHEAAQHYVPVQQMTSAHTQICSQQQQPIPVLDKTQFQTYQKFPGHGSSHLAQAEYRVQATGISSSQGQVLPSQSVLDVQNQPLQTGNVDPKPYQQQLSNSIQQPQKVSHLSTKLPEHFQAQISVGQISSVPTSQAFPGTVPNQGSTYWVINQQQFPQQSMPYQQPKFQIPQPIEVRHNTGQMSSQLPATLHEQTFKGQQESPPKMPPTSQSSLPGLSVQHQVPQIQGQPNQTMPQGVYKAQPVAPYVLQPSQAQLGHTKKGDFTHQGNSQQPVHSNKIQPAQQETPFLSVQQQALRRVPISPDLQHAPLSPVTSHPSHTSDSPPVHPSPQPVRSSQVPPQILGTALSLSRQSSSLDELLSSSPERSKDSSIPAPVIAPKVLTAQEIQHQKEEARKNKDIFEPPKEPYSTGCELNKFVSDVESFGQLVDHLTVQNVMGQCQLDTLWKELMDNQEHEGKKHSIAIARCYPLKNRDPDVMPYDETRVLLSTLKDDYINASWINDLAPSCPKFITSQSPIPVTVNDFWVMIYEQGVEVVAMLTSEYETGKRYPCYWPIEKGKLMEHGPIVLNLQSVKYKNFWTERIIHIKHSETKQGRTVVHLQYKNWPVSGFPENVSHIVNFITEVHSLYRQQRSLMKPVLVHCGNGIGRSGSFLLIYTGMQEILHGNGMIDVQVMTGRLLQKRKNIIQNKEQLKFSFDSILYFAEDFLRKKDILVKNPHFAGQKKNTSHRFVPLQDDIVLGSVNLEVIKKNVGKLSEKHMSDTSGIGHTIISQGQTTLDTAVMDEPFMSSLPDLVQPQTQKDLHVLNTNQGADTQAVSSSEACTSTGNTQIRSRSDSNSSVLSGSSVSTPSVKGSPQHKPEGEIPASLIDLQNPSTFTLGTSSPEKKKITKASFTSKSGSLKENLNRPDDPLSNLDPLWSIGKEN